MGENTKRYVAEFFGTAVLVLIGCGAVAIGTNATGPTAVNVLGIAFAFGLAVTAMAYGIGPISGCHINPAVTLGMTSAGRLPAREVPGYIIGQLLGGVAGAAVLYVILSSKLAGYDLAASGLGQNGWGEGYLGGYGLLGALVTEFVATFIFVYVILAATNPTVNLQVEGLIIGLTLFALHFPFINVTGLSVNPARSLGPAVLVGGKALAQVWLFLVVPSVAGACAGLLFREAGASPTARGAG